MTAALFYIFAALMLGASLYVVLNRNPVYSVVALVFSFLNLAALYFLLEAYFIGILEILVYAGAIMVLFLFVVMLLNVQADKPARDLLSIRRWWYGLLVLSFLVLLVLFLNKSLAPPALSIPSQTGEIGTVEEIGQALFSHYLLPFEVASLLLTVALVGTVFLTKKRI